jgi:hypothetical protein
MVTISFGDGLPPELLLQREPTARCEGETVVLTLPVFVSERQHTELASDQTRQPQVNNKGRCHRARQQDGPNGIGIDDQGRAIQGTRRARGVNEIASGNGATNADRWHSYGTLAIACERSEHP